ncbi:MAG: hypothetical protein EXR75_05310 [Myxococcales bacterium]|nr:hypothetical protein [Myxococcales bacterium]
MSSAHWRRQLAIGLVSATVLLVQLALTRVLSVLFWYHWAFLAISLTMLGMGVPGVWLAVSARRPRLESALLLAGVLTPLGVGALVRVSHHFGAFGIVFAMACLLPAMLALGTAICLFITEAEGDMVARIYASDLFGACVGAFLAVPLLWVIPTPLLAAGAGFLPLAACALSRSDNNSLFKAALSALVLAASLFDGRLYELTRTKEYEEVGAFKPTFVRWTPTARLAVMPSIPWSQGGAFLWSQGAPTERQAPEQYWLEQDGSAGTPITRYDGDDTKLAFLFDDVTSVGYELAHPKRVAVVGAGGGRDIHTARLAGATSIDAIELNAGIVEALRGPFAAFSGGVYDLPGVSAIVGEGRSVLTRSVGAYDFIQISMIDSWAATAAGAFSLSENNLYTVEAYQLYFRRLAPRGIVSTSRWLAPQFGVEVPRLYFLVEAALAADGIARPAEHIAVVGGGLVATVLMSKEPFSPEALAQLALIAKAREFTVLFPEAPGAGPLRGLARVLREGPAALEKSGVRVSPPTDDKPFFFQMTSVLMPPSSSLIEELGNNLRSVRVLRHLMLAMAAVTLLLFFAPFVLVRRFIRAPGFWRGSGYFVAIGLAFMLVEIGWLQRCVLYLGHPSIAATVALGAMLLGAGLGAMLSRGLDPVVARRLGFVLPLAVGCVNAVLGPVMMRTLGAPLGLRIAVTIAFLLPASVPMGFAFPLGMMHFGAANRPWFWALNGAASVLASVASLAFAMEFGFVVVGYAGAALYLGAWALSLEPSRRRMLRGASIAAAIPLLAVSIALVGRLVHTIAARFRYPMDLEWMEGGQLVHAARLLDGRALYDACSDGFIAFAYPPVHAAVLAALGVFFGLDYAVGRALSIAALACTSALLCREAALSTRSRPLGWLSALVVLACVAAGFPVTGAWYDLVRVDSLYLALLIAGAVLSVPPIGSPQARALSGSRVAVAALLLTLAVFTKQTAFLFLPWILGFALWRHPMSGMKLATTTALLSGVAFLSLQHASGGHFWTFVFEVMRGHRLEAPRGIASGVHLLQFVPYLPLLVALVVVIARRRRLDARFGFWVGLTLTAVAVSLLTSAKIGAYVNNLAAAVLLVPMLAVMTIVRLLESTPERRAVHHAVAVLAALLFTRQLHAQQFPVNRLLPGPERRSHARALTALVGSLDGGVAMPAASFLPVLAGSPATHFHEQGYVDVMGSSSTGIDVVECISHLEARWLVMSTPKEPQLDALLSTMYEPRGPLPLAARPSVLGAFRVAAELYERRRDVRPVRPHLRTRPVFDLAGGAFTEWKTAGRAFDLALTAERRPYQQIIVGARGAVVNTFHPVLLDEARGVAVSPPFLVDRALLGFRFGGGKDSRLVVELRVGAQVVRALAGAGRDVEVLLPVVWDVTEFAGKHATITLVDDATGAFGHLLASGFELYDE